MFIRDVSYLHSVRTGTRLIETHRGDTEGHYVWCRPRTVDSTSLYGREIETPRVLPPSYGKHVHRSCGIR